MLRKFRISLFARFLISNLVIMLIPAVILFALYLRQTTHMIWDEILSSINLDQQYAIDLFDGNLADINNTSNQFQLTRGFRSYLDTHHFYSSEGSETYGEIIEDIFSLRKMNSLAQNFFVYFYDAGCVFSADGLHEISTLINTDYVYNQYTSQEFLKLLQQVQAPQILYSQDVTIHGAVDKYVTFLYPLWENFSKATGVAVFCVKTNQITDLFSDRLYEYNTSTYILDDFGRVIACHNPVNDLNLTLLSPNENGKITESLAYYIVRNQSKQNGWTYVTLVPKQQDVFLKMFQASRHFILYSSLTLLFSCSAVFLIMRANFSPIRKLKEKASQIAANGKKSTELETISYTLDYLHQQNDYLSNTMISNVTPVKNNRLRNLLNGIYISVEEFNSDCEQLSLKYSWNLFFVAIVMYDKISESSENVAETIREKLEEHFESRYIYNLRPDLIVTINCISYDNSSLILDSFCTMLKTIHRIYGVTATVGLGRVYEGTTQIGKSYIEAQSAIDYRFVKGKGTVIRYSDICFVPESLPPYPYGVFEKLKNAVAAGNSETVTQYINDLLDYISNNNTPLFLARGICFDILKIVGEGKAYSKSNTEIFHNIVLFDLPNLETAQEVVQIIQKLRTRLDDVQNSGIHYDQKLIDEIMDYTRENCLKCDFSIHEISNHLGILPSNMSTFFKRQTGHGILEYVIDVRMEKAKELLRDTNLTLKEISLQIGYYNVPSFIRRFKVHEGITPGSYRNSAGSNPQCSC